MFSWIKNHLNSHSRSAENVSLQTPVVYIERAKIIKIIFFIIFGIIWARIMYLQLISDARVASLIQTQYQKRISIRAKRGFIYDQNNEEMAISLNVASVFCEPRKIEPHDLKRIASELSRTLKVPFATIIGKINSTKSFVWIKRQIDPQAALEIQKLNLPHIHMINESKRFYPNGSLAGQILGFTDIDANGIEGLEQKYDRYLQGQQIDLNINRDAKGRRLLLEESAQSLVNKQGASIKLSLDKNIQYIVEKALNKKVKETEAKSGCAIVLNPFDGRILALANSPSFDPNIRSSISLKNKRNRCISDAFEPGSTFKLFIVAAALEKKAVSLTEPINCENGVLQIGKRFIRDDHPYEFLTPHEIIRSSSNIGTYKIAKRIGKYETYRYLTKFGFSRYTDIDLNGESAGLLHSPQKWKEIRFSNIAFGQGMALTPIQLITSFSSIANGGFLVQPHLVEKVTSLQGENLYTYKAPFPTKVISRQTSKSLTKMLEAVVYHEKGTGRRAKVPGYQIAGKTGTSEKFDPQLKMYSLKKRVASFIGFAPSDSPKIIVLVSIDEPKKGQKYGGVVSAPVFSEIVQSTLKYLGVKPNQKPKAITIAEHAFGKPMPLFKPPNSLSATIATATETLIKIEKDFIQIFDLKGLSIGKVFQKISGLPLQISLQGSGVVTNQHPKPGSKLLPGDTLTLFGMQK